MLLLDLFVLSQARSYISLVVVGRNDEEDRPPSLNELGFGSFRRL